MTNKIKNDNIMTLTDTIINSYKLSSSKRILNDSEKANLLFDIVLELIIKNKWTFLPEGNKYSLNVLLNSIGSESFQVNCFDLSNMFITLCKLIGIRDVDTFLYAHKPTSKIGQQLNEESSPSSDTFRCFDKQFEFIDNQICFDWHSVAKVNGRFYDLVFSCSYKHENAPYDVTPFGKVFSYLDSNKEMEALHVLKTSEGIDLEQTFGGETLLHIAARNNFFSIVSFLLSKGVDANKLSKLNPPTVALANVADINFELYKLLSEKTDPLIVNSIKQYNDACHFNDAVCIITNGGSVEELSEAIQGTDINFKGDLGLTLLHHAAYTNNLGIIEFLLGKGADANIKEDGNLVPLDYVTEINSSVYRLLDDITEKSIVEHTSDEADLPNDETSIPTIDDPEFNPHHQKSIIIESPVNNFPELTVASSSGIMNISMQILGGFMAVIGCAAVAAAFILLNASTLGLPGIVVAGLGVASTLISIGLFATGTYKNGLEKFNKTVEVDSALTYTTTPPMVPF